MTTYTIVHVVISVIGIGSGLVVVAGLLAAKRFDRWSAMFLASTIATSVTGFGFPFERLLPSHVRKVHRIDRAQIASPRRLRKFRATIARAVVTAATYSLATLGAPSDSIEQLFERSDAGGGPSSR